MLGVVSAETEPDGIAAHRRRVSYAVVDVEAYTAQNVYLIPGEDRLLFHGA